MRKKDAEKGYCNYFFTIYKLALYLPFSNGEQEEALRISAQGFFLLSV
jgi:hypothetical protein